MAPYIRRTQSGGDMDRVLRSVKEDVICLGGSIGISPELFWERLAEHYKGILGLDFTEAAKASFWDRLTQIPTFKIGEVRTAVPELQDQGNLKILVDQDERLKYLLHDKAVRINELQLKALELISSTGRKGITQSDLARQLNIDPRSLFHQLKAPLDYGLLTRMPVSYQKTFTYIIYLTRLAPQDETEVPSTAESTKVKASADPSPFLPAMSTIRSRVMEIIEAAPQRTIASTEVYRVMGNLQLLRMYRRQINWLICHGYLECFVAGELGGVTSKILKFKRPFILQESSQPSVVDSKESATEGLPVAMCGAITTLPLEAQVHSYIDRSGSRGVVLTELMQAFGLDRKYCYRIAERLTSRKVYSDSKVIKTAEFDKKERRLRFYTEEGRNRSAASHEFDKEIAVLGSLARDSVNRAKRGRELLNLIDERIFVEVGKSLAGLLQSRLNEKDYTMDVKTLRRLIEQLETEKLVRVIIIVLQGRQKTIVTKVDVQPDDPRITEYVNNLESTRMELKSVKSQQAQNDSQQAVTLEEAGAIGGRLYRFNMQKSGYVFGVMKRCKLLHSYLVEKMRRETAATGVSENSWICETLPCFFKKIPFSLFRQIVGVTEMSSLLQSFISSSPSHELLLDELPDNIQNELHRRRLDRHKTVVKTLMDLMCQLGLATPDNRYPSVAFRLPFQYKLSKTGVMMDVVEGKADEALDFNDEGQVELYWSWLSSLSKTDLNCISPNLPAVYKICCSPESWQVASPIGRALRASLRMIANQELDEGFKSIDEREERLEEAALDFAVDLEIIQRAYAEIKAGVISSREKRLSDLHNKRLLRQESRRSTTMRRHLKPRLSQTGPDASSSEDDSLSSEGEGGKGDNPSWTGSRKSFVHDFSASQLETIFIGYFVLHKSHFRNAQGNLQWSFLEQHMRSSGVKSITAEELRTFIGRYSASFRLVKKLNKTIFKLRCIDAMVQRGALPPLSREKDDDGGDTASAGTSLEDTFTFLLGRYSELLPQVPTLVNQLRSHSPNKGSEGLIFLAGEPMIDMEQQYRKFARAQQMAYFTTEKPFFISLDAPRPGPDDTFPTAEWNALRKTMAIPSETYSVATVKQYLAPYPKHRIDETLQEMLEKGLLSRSELARYKFRLAGGEFFIHEDFCALVDGLAGWPPSPDSAIDTLESTLLGSLVDSLIDGRVKLSFEIGRNCSIKPIIGKAKTSTISSAARLEKAISRFLTTTIDNDLIWMGLEDEAWPSILRAACKLVYDKLSERPGASTDDLISATHPILSGREVQVVLEMLSESGLAEREEGIDCYFCLSL